MKKIKLKDISLKVGSGATPKGGKESYQENGISLIRSMNIFDFVFKKDGLAFINKDQAKKLKNVTVKENDILLNITGASVARCCMVPSEILPARVNQHVCIIRINESKANPFYVLNYINSPAYKQFLLSLASVGGTREALTKDGVEDLEINLPSLPTQKKIAAILSAYDDLIENNNQRIRLLEEMAEEIYKEWFVRLRFPGYREATFRDKDGKEVPHGTVGGLPEGWEVKKLRSCLDHYIGGGWGQEIPQGKDTLPAHVIRGTDIPGFNQGNLNFDVLRFHKASNLSTRICKPNDIIFEVSGGTEDQSLGRTCFMSQSAIARFDAPVIPASFCKLMRINPAIVSPYYINAVLNKMYATNELMVFQVQSTGISNYQFEDFIDATRVLIPTERVQTLFDEVSAPMIDEIQLLGAKNQVLRETRDLLLPRLISGKLRVDDLEVEKVATGS